jgi:uncharacterized protein YerC
MLPVNSKPGKIAQMLVHRASYNEIHNIVHVSFSTIAAVKRAIEENAPLPPVKVSGCPPKLSLPVLKMTRAQMMANPLLSGKSLSQTIAAEAGSPISRQTLNRIRRLMYFTDTTPRKYPQLSDHNIQRRLGFRQKVLATPSVVD